MDSFQDLFNIISIWNQGGAQITVTYEALETAASDVLQRVQRLEGTCDQLENLCAKMASYWDSEARELNESSMREQLEQIEILAQHFRKHAENLSAISANYLKTSSNVEGRIQTLSTDVIL